MDAPPVEKKAFTFQDLLRIALGAPFFTGRHLRVLQILFECLLRRLGCEDEVVTIGGFPSTCLKNILPNCKASIIEYQYPNEDNYKDRWSLMKELEDKMKIIEEKWLEHTKLIRWYTKQRYVENDINWIEYVGQKEDLFQRFTDDERFRELYKNRHFTTKLHKFAADPMLKHVEGWLQKLEEMDQTIVKTSEILDANCPIQLILEIMGQIEKLRLKNEENHAVYEQTITEIESMLECKLERSDLLAMKQYMRHKLTLLRNAFARLTKVDTSCPSGKRRLPRGGFECLSCNRPKIKAKPEPRIFPKGSLLGDHIDSMCHCGNARRETLHQRLLKAKNKVFKVSKGHHHHHNKPMGISSLSKSLLHKMSRSHHSYDSDSTGKHLDKMIDLQLIDGLHKLDGYISLRVDDDIHRMRAKIPSRSSLTHTRSSFLSSPRTSFL